MITRSILLILLISFCLISPTIQAQMFFTYENAPTLGKGNTELSGQFTHTSIRVDGEGGSYGNFFGLRVGHGFSENFDVKLTYTRFDFDFSSDINVNYFFLTPKTSFANNKLAFMAPFGLWLVSGNGESETDFFLIPTLGFSQAINQNVELGTSIRFVVVFDENLGNLLGFNLTSGLSKDLSQWAFRPEFGILFELGEEGIFLSFGMGFAYYIGGNRG